MRAEDARRMLSARDDEKGRRVRRRPLWRRLLSLVIFLAVYVLSIGPLYWKWYAAKVGVGSPIYLILYRPLEQLAGWIPSLGHFLNWYITLWIY